MHDEETASRTQSKIIPNPRFLHTAEAYFVWQYGLLSFQAGGTKLERFLHKSQHTLIIEF